MRSSVMLFKNLNHRILGYNNLSSKCDDLQGYFLNPHVHNLLQQLVSISQPSLIHTPKFKVEKDQDIKLLTVAELEAVQRYSEMLTSQKLQMPPVMNPRPVENHESITISKDPELCGILPSNQKMVFVDIGLDFSRRKRLMVVREPNGTLRYADSSERDRLNQIFFPLPGKKLRLPLMFTDANLDAALRDGSHEYILDRLLIQFEPDDPEYIRISHRVYDDAVARIWSSYQEMAEDKKDENVLEQQKEKKNLGIVSRLRTTRHYGPMALYIIAKMGKPESLIQETLSHQALDTLHHLIHLTCIIHPDKQFAKTMQVKHQFPPPLSSATPGETLRYVQTFIENSILDENHKAQLQLSLIQCQHSFSESIESTSQDNLQ